MASRKEVWRDVLRYSGYYQVSNWGSVRSLDRLVRTVGGDGVPTTRLVKGRLARQCKDDKGRCTVNLSRGNRNRVVRVHRLVLEAFVGPCPSGMECCHWDDDPSNNQVDNLRWGTSVDNMQDRLRNGRQPLGSENAWAVLTEEQVREARRLRGKGWKYRSLQERYGCGFITIYKAVVGVTWRHVT